jgi:hypothetical protein
LPPPPEDGLRYLPDLLLHAFALDGREGLAGWQVDVRFALGVTAGPFVLGRADRPGEERAAIDGENLVLKSGEVFTVSGHLFYALLALDRAAGCALRDAVLVLPGPEGSPPGLAVASDPQLPDAVRLLRGERRFEDLETHPYAYYDAEVRCRDPHLDPRSGWPLEGLAIARRLLDGLARRREGRCAEGRRPRCARSS